MRLFQKCEVGQRGQNATVENEHYVCLL